MVAVSLRTVPRYDPGRTSRWGAHAVVVGAGVAGLLAARVLSDGFDAVTVVDRDDFPEDPVARRGVPQSAHIHILMVAGQHTIEDLCPGFGADLLAAGGLVVDGTRDVHFFIEGGYLADGPRRVPLYCATRPLYERTLRRHVADAGVHLRPNCGVVDYLADEVARDVEGVVVRTDSGTEELPADLVVDATGRTSRTPAWLERRGYAPPTVDEVTIELAYSTTFVRRPADDRRAFVVTPSPPDTRGAGVVPVEGNRWLMTLFGVHGDAPPDDEAGLRDFAAGLAAPDAKRLLDAHPQVADEIASYRFPANRRHYYEELDRFPEGLVVVGDAVASFNPIYAQGMSVAALESLVLHRALSTGGTDGLAHRFFEGVRPTVDLAWNMAVGADHQFPRTEGPKPRGTDVLNRYLARLLRKAHTDGVLSGAFFSVQMMERPPASLFRPGVLWRVLRPS